MKLRRIDYASGHPHNINVNDNPAQIYPVPPPLSIAFISPGKTSNPKQDWKWIDGRAYEDGAQGFFLQSDEGIATVWMECPENALTLAEQLGPGEICIVCIPRANSILDSFPNLK